LSHAWARDGVSTTAATGNATAGRRR
jgi:hypothetical protein